MRYWWLQREGRLYDEKGWVCNGYSGHGKGVNNPDMQDVPDVGPIPSGTYAIGQTEDSIKLGPHVHAVTPLPGTRTYGRSGFYIHGDSMEHPGMASHGCVIVPRWVRNEMNIGDTLTVVSQLSAFGVLPWKDAEKAVAA